jgi:lactoylglutathione lyase
MKLKYNLFYVDDVPAAMDFYENAFGLTKGFLHESNEYGEMSTGATTLGFVNHNTASSHGFTYRKPSLKDEAFAFEIGFVTENVQEAFDKAVKAGAIAVSSPTQKPWGQMVSYVRDLNGFLVEICSAMG